MISRGDFLILTFGEELLLNTGMYKYVKKANSTNNKSFGREDSNVDIVSDDEEVRSASLSYLGNESIEGSSKSLEEAEKIADEDETDENGEYGYLIGTFI